MSEQSFEQMLEESFKTIHTGEVVDGTVISVKEDEIVLNIGYKADGIITRSEYTNKPNVDLRTVVSEGDTMKAKVLKVNDGDGQVLLTYRRLVAEEGNKKLEEAYNNKEVITAKVDKAIPGGLSVVIDEARVFIPASLISDTYEKDLTKFEGQEVSFVITSILAELTDFFTFQRCHGEEQRILRRYSRLETALRHSLRRLTVLR